MSFETKMKELEKIVNRLESPEMGIDEGVKLFDDGIVLAKECYELLNASKGKVTMLSKELDEVVEKPFKKED
ncbi:MAG: exodeoxyribonuclease VII small subunit [Spirochaetales bacterium]